MTGFAVHADMFPLKPEFCFIMIKIIGTPDGQECLFAVALPAILSKLVLMGIFMTIDAIGKWNTLKLLKFLPIRHIHFMTFDTIHILMLSQQLKPGVCMVKYCGRLKGSGIVASQTIGGKRFPVVIVVTV
jgi:hypothetical protein